MTGLASTLATIWRLAAPYFRSEDRLAGRLLLAAVICIELAIVAINVMINQWNARFYNALQDKNWDAFVSELLFFCMLVAVFIVIAVYQLYLNQWLQIRWRRWMTQQYLSHWLDGSNHYRMQLLGDAADNPDQRIAEDINLFIEKGLYLGLGLLNSVVTLGSFVVILWALSASAPFTLFGIDWAIPGIPGLGGADLFDRRHRDHPLDRQAADRSQLHAAALRGRLPLQSHPGAGEFRADRPARRRSRREPTTAGSLRPRGRQLDADHVAHQEADVLQRGLCPGVDRVPLRGRQPGVFRGLDSARRPDADRVGLQQRAGRAVVLRQLEPSTASSPNGAR